MSRTRILALLFVLLSAVCPGVALAQAQPSEAQLANWLKRFPEADTNGDGKLTVEEADAYRKKVRSQRSTTSSPDSDRRRPGAPRSFTVDPGWEGPAFPEHAVFRKDPGEIAAVYKERLNGRGKPVTSFERPGNGALRIVGTGHSFMAPGYNTFPVICEAAGFEQPLLTHTGGGITGSTRYKWEQENGIFQFEGDPLPKLLASIANAEWEAMTWGPYFNDRPQYYSCWIDFCLNYNPAMRFYLSDAWLQLYQLGEMPANEDIFTEALEEFLGENVFERLGTEKRNIYVQLVEALREDYPGKVFIMPTCDAMTIAAKHYARGELPGIEGVNTAIGGKARSLWRDPLGHIGPGFDRLEGYVFYATIYGRSPEKIEGDIPFRQSRGTDDSFPTRKLDRLFRKIAWQAVTGHPLSGVTDRDGDGVKDVK